MIERGSATFLKDLIKLGCIIGVAAGVAIPFTNSGVGLVLSEQVPFSDRYKLSAEFLFGSRRAISELNLPYEPTENALFRHYYVDNYLVFGLTLAAGKDLTIPENDFSSRFKNIQ